MSVYNNLRLASLANGLGCLFAKCPKGYKKLDDDDTEIVSEGIRYFRNVQKGYDAHKKWQTEGVISLSRETIDSLDALDEVKEILPQNDLSEVIITLSSVLEHAICLDILVQRDKTKLEFMRNVFHKIVEHALRNPYHPPCQILI